MVTPAQALMAIVPKEDQAEVEAVQENKGIGFVKPGQVAEIKVETLPSTRYGTIPGQVNFASGDAIKDDKQGLIFRARRKPNRNAIRGAERNVSLSPCMAVSVEIKTEQRRVIGYFLSPVLGTTNESLRERRSGLLHLHGESVAAVRIYRRTRREIGMSFYRYIGFFWILLALAVGAYSAQALFLISFGYPPKENVERRVIAEWLRRAVSNQIQVRINVDAYGYFGESECSFVRFEYLRRQCVGVSISLPSRAAQTLATYIDTLGNPCDQSLNRAPLTSSERFALGCGQRHSTLAVLVSTYRETIETNKAGVQSVSRTLSGKSSLTIK